MEVDEIRKCPSCSSVMWPNITNHENAKQYWCPRCNNEYAEEEGILRQTDGRWLI